MSRKRQAQAIRWAVARGDGPTPFIGDYPTRGQAEAVARKIGGRAQAFVGGIPVILDGRCVVCGGQASATDPLYSGNIHLSHR